MSGRPAVGSLIAGLFAPSSHLKRLDPVSGLASARLEDIAPVYSLPSSPWGLLWQVASRHYRGRYILMIAFVALGQGIETVEPYALKRLVNSLLAAVGPAAGPVETVMLWFGVMVAMWFSATLLLRCYQIVDIFTGPYLRERVQNLMFGYLLGHSPRYFQENFAGKLGQKIKEAGRACIGLLELITFEMTRIVIILSLAITLLATQQPLLAILFVGWAIIYVGVSGLLAYRCVRMSKEFSAAASTSAGKLIDAITNADSIRAFARWRHERSFLSGYLGEERNRSVRLRWFLTLMRVFQAIAVLSMLSVLVYIALRRTLDGAMDIGSFTMVLTLTNMVGMNVWNLSNRMLDFFEQTGTLTEALELVSHKHEIVDRPGAVPLKVDRGAIRFENVDFGHPDGQALFTNLNLGIRGGEKVALVGPSGAGKSTLVKLLRRQFEPQGGRILIDGQDVNSVTWDSVNEAIAEVSQAPGIFHRPVRENIRYGELSAEHDDVVEAALKAHCDDFIRGRPEAYDTIVGEQGIKLSGGERQRVAIARALLKNAPILVLDEATSSLDSESEHLIQKALWRVMQGRTVIAIAHRLSTITSMDRILYLERGHIIEEGSHAELVARGGAYARLWSRQVMGFDEGKKAALNPALGTADD